MAKKNHYVNNADFLKALTEYKKACRKAKREGLPKPNIPDYIGKCLMLIAENLSHKPNFLSYCSLPSLNTVSWWLFCGLAASRFLFYWSLIIATRISAFIRRIHKEKKQLYVKYKSTEQIGILDEHDQFDPDESGGVSRQFEMYDNISEFIVNFEESKLNKKNKRKKKKSLENFIED